MSEEPGGIGSTASEGQQDLLPRVPEKLRPATNAERRTIFSHEEMRALAAVVSRLETDNEQLRTQLTQAERAVHEVRQETRQLLEQTIAQTSQGLNTLAARIDVVARQQAWRTVRKDAAEIAVKAKAHADTNERLIEYAREWTEYLREEEPEISGPTITNGPTSH